jgi:predicted nucleic acid-binding protein
MVKVLIDTNILIDYLNQIKSAKKELEKYSNKAISVITWMEVMVGASSEVEDLTKKFLNQFKLININQEISVRAVELRKKYRIKLPDAIVWASAEIEGRILVTRNFKDFSKDEPGIYIPYKS